MISGVDFNRIRMAKWRRPSRPVALQAYVAVAIERKARELERYFKSGSGKALAKKRFLGD